LDGGSKFKQGGGTPVWIIRNGVNDEAQNKDTEFNNPEKDVSNGNGAAALKVKKRYWVTTKDSPGEAGTNLDISAAGKTSSGGGGVSVDNDLLKSGIPIKGETVWDAYEQESLSIDKDSGLVEWDIDWNSSGVYDSDTILYYAGSWIKKGGNLILDGGRLKLTGISFDDAFFSPSDYYYRVTVTAKLKKGIKGTGADYTGSILIHLQ
jgi:hypothetical protein